MNPNENSRSSAARPNTKARRVLLGIAVSSFFATAWLFLSWLGNTTETAEPGVPHSVRRFANDETIESAHHAGRAVVETAASRVIGIRVLATNGEPVLGASVGKVSSPKDVLAEDDDADGVILLSVADLDAVEAWTVSATGFHPESLAVSPRERSEYEVRLRPLSCIRGVVSGLREAQSSPVMVAAFPEGVALTAVELAENPRVKTTLSDAGGRFIFCDLDPDPRWNIVAGTQGFATSVPVLSRPSDLSRVDLQLQEYSVLAIEFGQADGGSVCISPLLHSIDFGFQCVQRSGVFVDGRSAQAFLAGVPLDWCIPRGERYILVCESTASEGGESTLRCKSKLPGYDQVEVDLQARALVDGFSSSECRLVRSSGSLGSIRVTLLGLPDTHRVTNTGLEAPLQLVLSPLEGGRAFRFRIPVQESNELRIDCIPSGRYRAWLECMPRRPIFSSENPSVNISVSDASVSDLVFDLGGTGSLEVQLVTSAGERYLGPALLLLEDGFPNSVSRGRFAAFQSGPYRLPWIAPGEYRIWPGTPDLLDTLPKDCPWLSVVEQQEVVVSYSVSE